MKKNIKMSIAFLLTFSLLFPLTTHADQKKIQNDLSTAKDRLAQLESSKTSVESYIAELNGQITDINDSITALEEKQKKKEEEIDQIKEELEEAKAQEAKQYEAMKKRIKYLYEADDLDIISIILGAKDMPDMLNQIEFVNQISKYDREMLTNYQTLKADVKAKEDTLQSEKTALASLKEDKKAEKDTLGTLLSSASTELSENNSSITATKQEISDYEADLKKQEEKMASAQAKGDTPKTTTPKPAEKTPSADNNKNSDSNTSNTDASDSDNSNADYSDLELLAAIIECEAGGELMEGKVAVGNVVMNRVKSSAFPGTVLGVIYQSGQFSPVASGRFALVLARGASSSCRSAATQAMGGTNYVGSCLYFRPVSSGIDGLVIGNHVFY